MPFFVSNFRKFLIIKDSIAEHFGRYKKQYLVLLILIFSALIVGVIAGIKKAQISNIEGLPDITLLKYLSSNINIGGVFASRFFSTIGLLILVWLLSFNRFTSLFSTLILIYNAYIIGATCAMLLSLFRFAGFINILLVYLPCRLLSLLCLLVFSVVCIRFSFDKCNTASVLSFDFYATTRAVLVCVFSLLCISCVFELIFLPWVSSAIIVGIS